MYEERCYIDGKLVQFKLKWVVLEVIEDADDEGGSSSSLASFASDRFQDGTTSIDWAEILLRISLRDECMRVPALELADRGLICILVEHGQNLNRKYMVQVRDESRKQV